MVRICNKKYEGIHPILNEIFTTKYPYELSDFQKYAIEAIYTGNHVLITAHTGSGKTLPAEFAIEFFVGKGKKVIYTSPIKALSNQKYYEFSLKYPEISFGLFTGDIKTNPEADVLIMTTEILMNSLFHNNDNDTKNDNTQFKTEFNLFVSEVLRYLKQYNYSWIKPKFKRIDGNLNVNLIDIEREECYSRIELVDGWYQYWVNDKLHSKLRKLENILIPFS